MNLLEKAIAHFIPDNELIKPLAKALLRLSREQRMSFRELGEVLGTDPTEVLLAADEWRLILPVAMTKTSAWEDRVFESSPSSLYEIPNIIKYLVRGAEETGCWDPEGAVREMFKRMEVNDPATLAVLTTTLCKKARFHRITAGEIGKTCRELGLGDKVDTIIAILKGTGLMSPKMGSISEVLHTGTPIYEINPCVCVNTL